MTRCRWVFAVPPLACALAWPLPRTAAAQDNPPKPGKPATARRAPDPASAVEEVIVTATKRPEAVRRISGSVTAISGAQLKAVGAQTFADYLSLTPGVTFDPVLPGFSSVIIRGVATTTVPGAGQGTTGYFINDVPLTDPYFSVGIPDIDAFDVANVTTLRGPQGTLFGSASLGGAVNYQAAKPDLQRYSADVQANLLGTQHGDGLGGGGGLMVNLPLIKDVLAVRGVIDFRDDPGYIRNVQTATSGANQTQNVSGRFLATFKPTQDITLSYMFLRQRESTEDAGSVEPAIGKLEKSTIEEPSAFTTTLHNLRVDADLGFATATATATYHQKDEVEASDFSTVFGPILQGLAPHIASDQTAQSRGLTFEARLASPVGPGHRFDYVVGVMHDDTREHVLTSIVGPGVTDAVNTLFGPIFGPGIGDRVAADNQFFGGNLYFHGVESAAFGEASYHILPQLKLTAGGRLFSTRLDTDSTQFGFLQLLSSGAPSQTVLGAQSASGFSPKGSITYTPNANLMIYALVSKGFRYGGFNVNPPDPTNPTPKDFNSDKLVNYELGMRNTLLDRRLQIDATLYYVDWSQIQLTLQTPRGFQYIANAGAARNYGFEGTVRWVPNEHISWQSNFTYLNASLTSAFNPGAGNAVIPSGATLPGASKVQISNVLSYRFPELAGTPSATLVQRYISSAPGRFNESITQGNYNLLDLRLGIGLGTAQLTGFVTNLTDRRGIATALADPGFPTKLYLVRPRTFGLTLDAPF